MADVKGDQLENPLIRTAGATTTADEVEPKTTTNNATPVAIWSIALAPGEHVSAQTLFTVAQVGGAQHYSGISIAGARRTAAGVTSLTGPAGGTEVPTGNTFSPTRPSHSWSIVGNSLTLSVVGKDAATISWHELITAVKGTS